MSLVIPSRPQPKARTREESAVLALSFRAQPYRARNLQFLHCHSEHSLIVRGICSSCIVIPSTVLSCEESAVLALFIPSTVLSCEESAVFALSFRAPFYRARNLQFLHCHSEHSLIVRGICSSCIVHSEHRFIVRGICSFCIVIPSTVLSCEESAVTPSIEIFPQSRGKQNRRKFRRFPKSEQSTTSATSRMKASQTELQMISYQGMPSGVPHQLPNEPWKSGASGPR
jgi:hypothetical protein